MLPLISNPKSNSVPNFFDRQYGNYNSRIVGESLASTLVMAKISWTILIMKISHCPPSMFILFVFIYSFNWCMFTKDIIIPDFSIMSVMVSNTNKIFLNEIESFVPLIYSLLWHRGCRMMKIDFCLESIDGSNINMEIYYIWKSTWYTTR